MVDMIDLAEHHKWLCYIELAPAKNRFAAKTLHIMHLQAIYNPFLHVLEWMGST